MQWKTSAVVKIKLTVYSFFIHPKFILKTLSITLTVMGVGYFNFDFIQRGENI